MSKEIIVHGKNLKEAVEVAAEKLGCSVEKVEYQVIKNKSFLGIFKGSIKIKAWCKETPKQAVAAEFEDMQEAKQLAENIDGYFELQYTEKGVYLTIYPPKGKGKPVDIITVEDFIYNKKVKDPDLSGIKDAINSLEKKKIKIAEPQKEFKKDAEVKIEWSSDKLKGYITLLPPFGGKDLTKEQIVSKLKENGIVYGIDENKIDETLNNKVYNKKFLIAQGKPPVKGKDAKIQYYFNKNIKIKPAELENGSVNFYDLNIIQNVRKDQLLAKKVPPTQGEPGKNIFGEEIPQIKGKDARIPVGKNTVLSEDELECYSEIDGHVNYLNGKINVYPIYEVAKDVDTSTGNIDFNGTVVVKGNIRSNFSVKAEGDLIVNGCVEAANLQAKGNILLKRGMQGKDKGCIQCGGSVSAKYIEHCKVDAAEDILIEGAVMHSTLNSGGRIEIKGRKGLLVGGTIRAKEEVKAKTIGSPMGTATVIEVGIQPDIKQKYNMLKEEVNNLDSNLKKTHQALTLLERLKNSGNLKGEKAALYEKLGITIEHLQKQYQIKKTNLDELKKEIEAGQHGRVKASNTIYPGVKIVIGNACKKFKEKTDRALITNDGSDIRVGLYEGDKS